MTRDETLGRNSSPGPDRTTSGPLLRGLIQHPDQPRPALSEGLNPDAFVAVPDTDWGPPVPGRQCRWAHQGNRCPNRGVASLYRPVGRRDSASRKPWVYCADHLYGRWIEHGHVMTWRYQGALRGTV